MAFYCCLYKGPLFSWNLPHKMLLQTLCWPYGELDFRVNIVVNLRSNRAADISPKCKYLLFCIIHMSVCASPCGSMGSVCHSFCSLLQKQSRPLGEALDVSNRKALDVKNISYEEMPNQKTKKKEHFFKTKRIPGLLIYHRTSHYLLGRNQPPYSSPESRSKPGSLGSLTK